MSDIIIGTDGEIETPKPKKYVLALATLSPLLVAFGLAAIVFGLLGWLPLFDYGGVLSTIASVAPIVTWVLEIIAVGIGVIAFIKLPKKSAARKTSIIGVSLGSLILIIFAAIGVFM